MCKCAQYINLLNTNIHGHSNTTLLTIDDHMLKYKCFALALANLLVDNPIVGALLPRKMLINGKPILIEYGKIKADKFLINPPSKVEFYDD
uniref:NS6 protein n=1 Tax=Bird deltacoronavirus HKU20 TaxID=3237953 RepID=A0AB39AGC9_9NIDO